jgi:hypothetical protein
MNNCPDSTIAAGAWYEYFPCTRGIYSISLPCHVCISFDLLDHPCWRSDSYRGVLNISRHHRTGTRVGNSANCSLDWTEVKLLPTLTGTNCDIISYHHTKQDYTIFSAIISNSDISRIAYAPLLRPLALGGCCEGTHIWTKPRPARAWDIQKISTSSGGLRSIVPYHIYRCHPQQENVLFSRKRCTVS